MLRVAVLGGTRFIGWHVVESFLAGGAHVTVFHRGLSAEPAPFSGPVARVLGDRDKPESLEPLFRAAYDAVVDLSGYAPAHVAPLLSRWRGRIGHYLFCSSASVYSVPPPAPCGEEAPRTLDPDTYGGRKALAEDAVLSCARRHAWPATVVRPHCVFGRFDPGTCVFYAWRRIGAGRPIAIRPESAGMKMNLVWVEDLAELFRQAAGNPAAFGQAFNAAGAELVVPARLCELAAAAQGKTGESFVLDARLAEALPELGLPWASHELSADAGKARRLLGWKPTPLEQALARTWELCRGLPVATRWRPQRWEVQAREGLRPPAWRRVSWRVYDRLRRTPIADRLARLLKRG